MTPHEKWVARAMARRGWGEAEVMRALGYDYRDPDPPPKAARRRVPDLTAEQDEAARRMWAEGVAVRDIATEIGIGEQGVRDYMAHHRDGFEQRRAGRRRIDVDVERAARLRRGGATYDRISREMGVAVTTITARLHEIGL